MVSSQDFLAKYFSLQIHLDEKGSGQHNGNVVKYNGADRATASSVESHSSIAAPTPVEHSTSTRTAPDSEYKCIIVCPPHY